MRKISKGFTLVELLVVMAILGVLVTMIATGFRSSQARGRDAQRKSDLKQISSALELYYSDYSKYPDTFPSSGDQFTDGKTIYMKAVPGDPSKGHSYVYRVVDTPANQKFQLFARLENTEDKNINSTITQSCGSSGLCNFSITSSNTDASE